jgi:hypothetical protein
MHMLWGALIIIAGLFLVVCARLKCNFPPYRLLVARSRMRVCIDSTRVPV